jgi:hypothetical protein
MAYRLRGPTHRTQTCLQRLPRRSSMYVAPLPLLLILFISLSLLYARSLPLLCLLFIALSLALSCPRSRCLDLPFALACLQDPNTVFRTGLIHSAHCFPAFSPSGVPNGVQLLGSRVRYVANAHHSPSSLQRRKAIDVTIVVLSINPLLSGPRVCVTHAVDCAGGF